MTMIGTLKAPPVAQPDEPLLGVGRSGIVFRSTSRSGEAVARKVFDSRSLTRAVQYAVLGASNPYAWNVHAVSCAFLRRRILAPLVERWTGGRLRVTKALGHTWNETYKAYELHTELSTGRPPALHHPLDRTGGHEVQELVANILPRLRAHLRASGFDGLLWQAGLGNPVALSNFLLEINEQGARRWAWIDLESGVPALFPAHVPSLWRHYLPLCRKHGRPLFDDVDCDKLATTLADPTLHLDDETRSGLLRDMESLRAHQKAWRDQPRLQRSIRSQVVKGKISEDQGAWYTAHPKRWMLAESRRAACGLAVRGAQRLRSLATRLVAQPWARITGGVSSFLVSQDYRERMACRFLLKRIDSWEERGQLGPLQADALRKRAVEEGSSSWLSDFAVHLALKPVLAVFGWVVFPALHAAGFVDQATAALGMITSGSISRTLYTLGRVAQDQQRARKLPWIALAVGAVPVLGVLAFPAQIAWASREDDDLQAQFITYDGLSFIGRNLPLWGGPDTGTEHALNQLPDRLVPARNRRPVLSP